MTSWRVQVLELVANRPNEETVKAIALLLEQAKAGEIVGIAYVAMHKGPGYTGDIAGRAKKLPMYALGLVRALEKKLLERI